MALLLAEQDAVEHISAYIWGMRLHDGLGLPWHQAVRLCCCCCMCWEASSRSSSILNAGTGQERLKQQKQLMVHGFRRLPC
jgi:hypothetical protein